MTSQTGKYTWSAYTKKIFLFTGFILIMREGSREWTHNGISSKIIGIIKNGIYFKDKNSSGLISYLLFGL